MSQRLKLIFRLSSTPQYFWLTPKQEVMAFLEEGKVRVFQSLCPHMGARLGYEAKTRSIVCPWHGLCFSSAEGTSGHPRYRRLQELPARVEGDELVL